LEGILNQQEQAVKMDS